MAFHVDFSAKNVLKFNFGLLLAQKLKVGGHNAPPLLDHIFPKPRSNRVKENHFSKGKIMLPLENQLQKS